MKLKTMLSVVVATFIVAGINSAFAAPGEKQPFLILEQQNDDLIKRVDTIQLTLDNPVTFSHTLSSGPFLLAPEAEWLDVAVINDADEDQTYQVRIYQYISGQPKIFISGGTGTLYPMYFGRAGQEIEGTALDRSLYTEVVFERNSPNVFPSVQQWATTGFDTPIPSTLIPTGDFVEIRSPNFVPNQEANNTL